MEDLEKVLRYLSELYVEGLIPEKNYNTLVNYACSLFVANKAEEKFNNIFNKFKVCLDLVTNEGDCNTDVNNLDDELGKAEKLHAQKRAILDAEHEQNKQNILNKWNKSKRC